MTPLHFDPLSLCDGLIIIMLLRLMMGSIRSVWSPL